LKLSELTRARRITPGRSQRIGSFLERVNATRRVYPKDRTVCGIFRDHAICCPDAVALVYHGRQFTYGEVEGAASRLAGLLLDNGLRLEAPVGVLLDRSPAAIVAILGALKAGGAYLPLGDDPPVERIAQLLRDSRAPMLIAERSREDVCRQALERCPDLQAVLLFDAKDDLHALRSLDSVDCERRAGPSVDRSEAGALAYVMYTSGTTGEPKGVMIQHHSILRLVLNTNWIQLGPHTRILQTGPLTFDASTFEVWGALLNGGVLCIADRDELLDPRELERVIRDCRITTIWLTTGLFNALAANHIQIFAALDTVVCGGEKVSAHHLASVCRIYPGLTLLNGYGPTENTTFTTCYHVRDECRDDVPIGTPIANTTVYVLDDAREPVDVGERGELYAGGDGLARGYLNDPVLTAQKFIDHPLAGRLYRTGDLARWRPDGNVEFLGRADDQVKIRGYRIEPAEIEAHLLRHPHVKEAIVKAQPAIEGGAYLVAYYTARDPIEGGELRRHLQKSLPPYMVPGAFEQLDAFPLTANGKIDRSALAAPIGLRGSGEDRGAADNETETALVAIWQEVLDRQSIGVHDDFFELGGHSLNAVRLAYLVQQRLGFAMPFTTIFKASTIRQLAGAILDATRFGERAIDEAMVCLTPGRAGRCLFAFPPGTADALGYTELARRLGSWAVYGFNFIDRDTCLEEYSDHIVSVDPAGPYVLFGYSGGGNLAFRTAKELERRGRLVAAIVMLDSSRFLAPYRFSREEARRLATEFLGAAEVQHYAHTSTLRDKVMRTIERYYDFLSIAEDDGRVAADIHLIVSQESTDEYRDETGRLVCGKTAWAEATRGRFRVEQGAAAHGQMLHDPWLGQNVALVNAALEASIAADGPR
jgi:amino acid adenylation domain-containing protein